MVKNTVMLLTASSSHSKCFICKSKDRQMTTVKKSSIEQAYTNFKILIKHHARCCVNHLDNNGQIRYDEFTKIQTKEIFYLRETINKIETFVLGSRELGIFDQFKNMANIPEKLCFEVTGWKKKEFMFFADYISSINDTAGRTKEQLIAIYRYWLKKGVSQETLSRLKSNCTQNQMHYYLKQIRIAINKDFVPYFLGAKSRKREFFLQHNNITTKILHDLDDNTLAIVVDGTYTRIEKSRNNNFQYLTFSNYKYTNLIKPFLIVCSDGYIIDCYGPFASSNDSNDAAIFNYILETDKELKNILLPNKTLVIMDRGNN